MKLIKTASGEKKLKLSKKEWESIGEKQGWKTAQEMSNYYAHPQRDPSSYHELQSSSISVPVSVLQGWALDLSQGDNRPRWEIEKLLEKSGHPIRNPNI